jgi:hypothetical protein
LDSCWYNVYRGVTLEVSNTTISCLDSNSTFNVTVDANFVLNFFANDSAGNINYSNSSFTVDTTPAAFCGDSVCNGAETCSTCSGDCGSCSSDGGGGGGGGGGGSTNLASIAKLEIKEISAILSLGEEKSLQASVKNIGRVAANKCKLVSSKDYSNYIESNDSVNIGVGEIVDMKFLIKASVEGIDKIKLNVECLENITGIVPLKLKLIQPSLDLKINKMSFDKSNLSLEYSIAPVLKQGQEIFFNIYDSKGEVIAFTSQIVELKGEEYLGRVDVDLSKAKAGMLKVSVTDEKKEVVIEETVIYDGTKGLTGFAAFGSGGKVTALSMTILVFVILIIIVAFRILKHRKS